MIGSRVRMVLAGLACVAALAACDGDLLQLTGVRLAAVGTPGDGVTGVLYDISCADGTEVSQFVPLEAEGLPPHVSGELAGEAFADYFTTLPPGQCTVTATPMLSADKPSAQCSKATQEVTVVEGQTVEIVLELICQADPTGALDVVAVVTDGPSILDVVFEPSKFILACETLQVSVTAQGDGELTYTYDVTGAPAEAVYTLTPEASTFSFDAETPGAYTVLVTVTSGSGKTTLEIPIHVSADPTLGDGGCNPVSLPCGGACPDGSVCDPATDTCLDCVNYVASYETDPLADGWVLEGDTQWSAPGAEDGFVRLTEELQNQRGTLYHPTDTIPTGDGSIRFDFRVTNASGGSDSADGLALTIAHLGPTGDMAALVSGTENGGGIGYHYPEAVAAGDVLSAVTVEIDTFWNSPNGEWFEPAEETAVPHVAVHADLNSRPSGLVDYVDLPGIHDGEWHTARVDIVGGTLRIHIDGVEMLVSTPGLSFEGGQIFFSSSTGFESDAHDIDAVEILGGCGG